MLFMVLLTAISFPAAGDVEVTIEAPKTVEFSPAKSTGGKTGSVEIKVTVKNTGNAPIVFSQSKVDIKVLHDKKDFVGGYNAEPKKTLDAGQLKNGESREAKRTITFHTRLPDDGDKLTIVAEFDGVKAEKEFTVKRK